MKTQALPTIKYKYTNHNIYFLKGYEAYLMDIPRSHVNNLYNLTDKHENYCKQEWLKGWDYGLIFDFKDLCKTI